MSDEADEDARRAAARRAGTKGSLLWGNAQQVTIPAGATGTTPTAGTQVAKIEADAPESWCFLAFCQVDNAPAGTTGGLVCVFDVSIGVGRGQVSIPSFVQLVPADPATGVASLLNGAQSWTTAAQSLGQVIPGNPNRVTQLVNCDRIVAKAIQVGVRAFATTALSNPVVLNVGFYFAPFNSGGFGIVESIP